jgi:transposase
MASAVRSGWSVSGRPDGTAAMSLVTPEAKEPIRLSLAATIQGTRSTSFLFRIMVHAALVQPWSNGQTEGQITKLKLVKRQMYGRAKIDLLQARLIGAT